MSQTPRARQTPIALSIAKGLTHEQSNPSLRSGRTGKVCARSRSSKRMNQTPRKSQTLRMSQTPRMNQTPIALSIAKGPMHEQSNPSLRSGRTGMVRPRSRSSKRKSQTPRMSQTPRTSQTPRKSQTPIALSIAKGLMCAQSNPSLCSGRSGLARALRAYGKGARIA